MTPTMRVGPCIASTGRVFSDAARERRRDTERAKPIQNCCGFEAEGPSVPPFQISTGD